MKKLTYAILGLLVLSTLFLLGCNSTQKVNLGDTVSIQYTGTFTDGTVFENSWVSFVVWSGQVIAGLDKAVLWMKIWETEEVTITPDEWYGSRYNKFQLQRISKLVFDKMVGTGWDISWVKVIAWVTGVLKGIEKDTDGNEMVLRDINPRETWENLVYKVTLVSKK